MTLSSKLLATTVSAAALMFGAASAQTSDVSTATEGDYVSLTGTVNSVEEDSFTVDYGTNIIEAEFDDLFSSVEVDERLSPGDRVTVYGTVDDDWFEGRVIDVDTVYSSSSYTVYGANDVSASPLYYVDPYPADATTGTYITLDGEVTNTRGQSFVLNTGGTMIDVETDQLGYNPLDDMGSQQIETGDRVTVVGTLEDQLFEDSVLVADVLYSQNLGMNEQQTSWNQNNAQDTAMNNNQQGISTQQQRSADVSDRQLNAGSDNQYGQQTANNNSAMTADNNRQQTAQTEQSWTPVEERFNQTEFAMLDANGNGTVSQREFVEEMSDPANITRSEARRLFDVVARNDNTLTRTEFVTPYDEAENVSENVVDRETR
ncbi:hypothetical protein FF098_012790 [Parvularcula flava]|uniref:EF-hand domain-containing protein n=1 Tax=Aquisalinus luteolus TaxID=1566827 RepID=A0A8J3ES14_9PROT|nr:hypothetical protein [Aquisalinus luteolus]NHK28790.1 hypothetical protein [Aquisalinus luteolus]GGH99525.1 hypothetical protein GCM10011355_25690 [Aquisalinus luteolus]